MNLYFLSFLALFAFVQATKIRNQFSDAEKLAFAERYFQPLIQDELINPDLKNSQFSSSEFYLEPLVHPFSSDEELAREAKRDPFGFSHTQFQSSFLNTRMLQAEFERTRSPSVTRALRDVFGEGKRVVRNIEKSLPAHLGGQQITLNYDVTFVRGLVSIEAEADSVESVECPSNSKLRLHVFEGKLDTVSKWIPGSRYILSPELNCYRKSDEENKPAYLLVVRRHKVSDSVIEYDVEPITEQDCYMESKINFEMIPNEDLLREEMERMNGRFMDTSMLGSTPTSIPSYNTMWLAKERQSKAAARHSVDETKTLDLLNFNYNRNTGRASSVIDFYKTSSLSVQCTNCYAYIGFNFRFRMDTTFVWINILEATIEGNAKFSFETKVDFAYAYSNTWEKTIFQTSLTSIRFSVGPIPVIIDPSVKLVGRFEVNLKAAFRMTHVASFQDGLKIGFKYENKQITRINNRKGPTFTISTPKVSDDSGAELNAKLTLIPTLTLKFYSIAPLDLSFLPYIRLNAKLGNTACGKLGASYNTFWGMQFAIRLQKLQIPTNIFGIGGKDFDLGGLLPFPKIASDATFTVVSDRAISCSFCSGCASLTKLWNSASKSTIAEKSSFLEASTQLEDFTPSDFNTITLGKAVHSSVVPAKGQCHIFNTTSLDSALPFNPNFMFEGADSRKIHIGFEVFSLTGAVVPSLKLYYAQNANDVIEKLVTPVTLATSKVIEESWQSVTFALCNENDEVPPSMRYSFQTKPTATINKVNTLSNVVVKKDTVLQLRFHDSKSAANAERVLFVKNDVAGHIDATVYLYAQTEDGLVIMDKRYLLDTMNAFEEVALNVNPNFPHGSNDYLVVADFFGSGDDEESTIECGSFGSMYALLRTPETIPSEVNFLEIERSDASAENIWRYSINIKRENAIPETVCFYDQQRSNINAQKDCRTISEREENLFYTVRDETVKLGFNYFMMEFPDSHQESIVTVDEQVYVHSGKKMYFNLKPSTSKGDRFILFSEGQSYLADRILVSGRTLSRMGLSCQEDCGVLARIRLVDIHSNGTMTEKWVSEEIESAIDGYISHVLDYNSIKTSLSTDDAARVKEFRVVVDVISSYVETSKTYELWVDEIIETGTSITEFMGEVSSRSDVGRFVYYRIPKSVIEAMGGGMVARLNGIEESDSKIGIPQLYLQKNALPREFSFMKSAYEESTSTRLPIIAQQGDDASAYFLGVTTQSDELTYRLQFEALPPGTVEISYFIGGKKTNSLSIPKLKEYGLDIVFKLNSNDEAWSVHLTDPSYDTCRKLLSIFTATSNNDEWKIIQQHMINTLERAFDPNSKTGPSSFIEYEEKVVTLHFPPFEIGSVNLPNNMLVNVARNLDKEFFNSNDDRIMVTTGSQFYVENNIPQWKYFFIPIASAVVFCFFLLIALSVVGIIIYKSAVQGRKKNLSKKLTELEDTMLEDSQEVVV